MFNSAVPPLIMTFCDSFQNESDVKGEKRNEERARRAGVGAGREGEAAATALTGVSGQDPGFFLVGSWVVVPSLGVQASKQASTLPEASMARL